ncbi:hypothetical protein KJ885_01330 [Patescibacteria group bacterium]|nr:hypothetical protein [Patescibacteria group bacterium]
MGNIGKLTVAMIIMIFFWLGYTYISGNHAFGRGLIGGTWIMYLICLLTVKILKKSTTPQDKEPQ